jgi:NAD(P)H-dependent FMN reductase
MFDIPVLLGSVRVGRRTDRVARYLQRQLSSVPDVRSDLLDLLAFDLPIMEERLRRLDHPPPNLVAFSEALDRADALAIVTPEYNGGIPGALKNALDLVLPELGYKPVGVVTVSSGPHGGISALAELRLVLLRMNAVPIPAHVAVANVDDVFPDDTPVDVDNPRYFRRFVDRLVWYTDALTQHKRSRPFPG